MAAKGRGKFVVDEEGKPVSVLLAIKAYRRILKDLEELDAIRAYDAAKASRDEVIPFEKAIQEIESSRR